MSRQNSHIFYLKKTSIIRTTHTKSRPRRVNSYKLNLFIGTLRWSSESRIPIRSESAQCESRLVWLMSYARWYRSYKAQSLYTKQRFAKGVQGNINEFLKVSITTDSIKIFSITFCTLVTVYSRLENSERRFQNCALCDTTFYMQHCAVPGRSSSFRFTTVICL